jgi:hypothetical protein
LLLFSPYLFQHRIPLNGDWLEARFLPWKAHATITSPNAELDDPILFQYPLRLQAATALRQGHWPLWNPSILCGTPLFEDQASMPLCPWNWLMVLLPPLDGWTWLLFTELAVAGIGMALLLDHFELPRFASLLGAVSFMLCAAFGQSLEWPSFLGTYGWLPWIALGVERMPLTGRRGAGLAALALGLQFWCGMVQLCTYVLGATLVLLVVRCVQDRRCRPAHALTLVLLGLGMGVAVLVPTAHLLAAAQRSAVKYSDWSRPLALCTYIWPDLFGHPVRGDYVPLTGLYELAFSGYIGLWSGCLALSAWRRDARRLPYQILAVLLPLYLLITAVPACREALVALVPALFTVDHLRSVGVCAFGAAVLAGFGAAEVITGHQRGRVLLVNGIAGTVLLGLVLVLEIWPPTGDRLPWFFGMLQTRYGDALLSPNLLWPMGLWMAFMGWTWLGAQRWPKAWGAITVMVVALDLLRGAWTWNPFVPARHEYPPAPSLAFLQQHQGDGRVLAVDPPDAIRGRTGLLPPNSALPYRLRDVRGYDSIWINRFCRLDGPQKDNYFHSIPNPDWPVVSLLGVRYVMTRDPMASARWKSVYDADVHLYENQQPAPRAFVTSRLEIMPADEIRQRLQDPSAPRPDTLWVEAEQAALLAPPTGPAAWQAETVDDDSFNAVSVDTDASFAGYLVLADAMYDGWTATIDGTPTPVALAYTALRAVSVPAGRHHVHFEYRPQRVFGSVALSLVALCLVLGFWLKN